MLLPMLSNIMMISVLYRIEICSIVARSKPNGGAHVISKKMNENIKKSAANDIRHRSLLIVRIM